MARATPLRSASSNPFLHTRQSIQQKLSWLVGTRGHRFPILEHSPNRDLALRLRSKTPEHKAKYRHRFVDALHQRNERLPLVAFQALLKSQQDAVEVDLQAPLSSLDSQEWEDRLRSLAERGHSREDIAQWVWIATGANGDDRVRRLISSQKRQPVFLLTLILRSDEIFRDPTSLILLMKYIEAYHCQTTEEMGRRMPAAQFLIILRRLVLHIRRLFPPSLPTASRLTSSYIQFIPASRYHRRCDVFNAAIDFFKANALMEPVKNMEYNWRAQKILLGMSDRLPRPLTISKASYRAIRRVMLSLRRSAQERAVANRYYKTWPPYYQDLDGLDAKRPPEDNHSRSFKAGTLMTEAGYSEDAYDRALSILGGTAPDGSPSIQTRGIPPVEHTGEYADRNVYSEWAARVRATRNQFEAWRIFTRYGKTPNLQVYSEMFLKLFASEVQRTPSTIPGDMIENLPLHDGNYSAYELARQAPPSVAELYDQMISRGVRPTGFCLQQLLKHATSLDEGLRYMRDSGIPEDTIRSFSSVYKLPSHSALARIPATVFSGYIEMLCKLQPNRQPEVKYSLEQLSRIRQAATLVDVRLRPETTLGATFRPPWHHILRALARSHVAVMNGDRARNDAQALDLCMATVEKAQAAVGVDPTMFLYLCRTVEKAVLSHLMHQARQDKRKPVSSLSVQQEKARALLERSFSNITHRVPDDGTLDTSSDELPLTRHAVHPVHLHAYMRALACLGQQTSMIELMRWMLTHRAMIDKEVDRQGQRARQAMAKVLCAFQAFASPALTQAQEDDLASRMTTSTSGDQDPWAWPSAEVLKHYIQSDGRGGSEFLNERARRVSQDAPATGHAISSEQLTADSSSF